MGYCSRQDRSPIAAERRKPGAIDQDHLARMTLGELSLQREVLALFDRQADLLLPRIRAAARRRWPRRRPTS